MERWQQEDRAAYISAGQLVDTMGLSESRRVLIDRVAAQFPLKITPYYLNLLEPGNADDPLLKMSLPCEEELSLQKDESADPLEELSTSLLDGQRQLLTQRYQNRVLVFPTTRCGGYCRFCFRKRLAGKNGRDLSPDQCEQIASYIEDRPSILEVILSGGDPLMLEDKALAALLERIRSIKHVRTIRLHSRMPVWNPYRLTERLVALLNRFQPVWFVVHINHPRELTGLLVQALSGLIERGVPVLNQMVLLKDVNDDLETLNSLCWQLVKSRIQPYYVHHLDKAQGTAHFRVPISKGIALMDQLRQLLPGYALPRYVLDLPGSTSKTPLGNHPVNYEL
ncbi:KamA family radical SAM protein [bacterium]|nr:KamA family radical SAM protein [bacterium]